MKPVTLAMLVAALVLSACQVTAEVAEAPPPASPSAATPTPTHSAGDPSTPAPPEGDEAGGSGGSTAGQPPTSDARCETHEDYTTNATELTLSDAGVGPFGWDAELSLVLAHVQAILGPPDFCGLALTAGASWSEGLFLEFFETSAEADRQFGWEVSGLEHPLIAVEGIGDHQGGLRFDTEPPGSRIAQAPGFSCEFPGALQWRDSTLFVKWYGVLPGTADDPCDTPSAVGVGPGDYENLEVWAVGADPRSRSVVGTGTAIADEVDVRAGPDREPRLYVIDSGDDLLVFDGTWTAPDGREWRLVVPAEGDRFAGWVLGDELDVVLD